MPVTNADVPSRSPQPMTHRSSSSAIRGSLASLLAVALAGLPLASCKSTSSTGTAGSAPAGAAAQPTNTPLTADDLDRVMVIGPTAARQLGYRIDWESKDVIPAGRSIRLMQPAGDALFVLDSVNDLARVKSADGVRIWQTPVGDPIDNVLGINRLSTPNDRVFVTVAVAIDHDGGAVALDVVLDPRRVELGGDRRRLLQVEIGVEQALGLGAYAQQQRHQDGGDADSHAQHRGQAADPKTLQRVQQGPPASRTTG